MMMAAARTVFDRAMEIVAAILVVALLTCVSLGIVTRAMGDPLIWTDEVSRFLMLWLAVVGWVLASRRRAHIRIRFFHDLLPPRLWRSVEIMMQVGMTLFGVLVGWYSVHLVTANIDLEATTVPISISWLYAPMVFAGAVTALQGLSELIENIARHKVAPYPADDLPAGGGAK
ncbi:TRAP transporter small permease [Bosea caraganae]|uniref:TRAP transporter small permease protein n=1 Tax=Bosea caraganae TaxID=2763117 RepID=A0A370KXN1_9HYPH|nr:TRAP transporter small permease [Bosea caraganae]RDJ19737.1 TRAP transporter small permease [Bosea caraganae]RDJ21382.1 TRAP transporter small permease [Bosea caraganae]